MKNKIGTFFLKIYKKFSRKNQQLERSLLEIIRQHNEEFQKQKKEKKSREVAISLKTVRNEVKVSEGVIV